MGTFGVVAVVLFVLLMFFVIGKSLSSRNGINKHPTDDRGAAPGAQAPQETEGDVSRSNEAFDSHGQK